MQEYLSVQKLNEPKHSNVKLMRKKKGRCVFKLQIDTDVLTELYGIIITLDHLKCKNLIRHLNGTNNNY